MTHPKDKTIKQILSGFSDDLIRRLYSAEQKRLYNISIPLFAAMLLHSNEKNMVIEDSAAHAEMLLNDLKYLAEACGFEKKAFHYLPPASLPESIGERAKVLHGISCGEVSNIITSAEALDSPLNADCVSANIIQIRKGTTFQRSELEGSLVRLGYRKVDMVMDKGEYAERGWLFDIFPTTELLPVRAEFFGDEIDVVRSFDIETQRSIKELPLVEIYPSDEAYQSAAAPVSGSSIFSLWQGSLFISEGVEEALCERSCIRFSHYAFAEDGVDAGELRLGGLGITPEGRPQIEEISSAIAGIGKKAIMVLASGGQTERLRDILAPAGITAPLIGCERICSYEGALAITQGRLSAGFHLEDLIVLTGREIFGEQPPYRPIKRSKVSRLLLTMDDLKPGDYVVHRDHGVGRFISMHREKIEAYEEDIITLEYAGGDRLYIPFQGIELLHKYSGGEGHAPSMDRLGSKRWQNTRKRVKKSVEDMAEKLLALYASREVSRGFVFSDDSAMHKEFDDFFPYEETEDQIKAVDAIKYRMRADKPMDMLICGDVGYGKTEVAIKAAFRAVYDNKQVAVLVPTTLLAEQHYRTFKTRFSAFPVRIDYLSRFKGARQAAETIKALKNGEVDIIIGTHMLLAKTIEFQDLGLLIVDEEHRFGVAQKEKMKELRKGVDVITLTATPIPRTMQMSLSGVREMAAIETPPEERLAVRSVVLRKDEKAIQESIQRELRREGQVFFVHNRIYDIEKCAAEIRKLVPAARIVVAHGQMPERQLEKIMFAFLNKEADILISTAIISSGIDIASANTIIIDRADTFGLSDLYQLRGRVGRGNQQAYSYFLIPGEDTMSDDAKKRLQAIQEMSYLGAGFRLALKDLEIRGAGNILGAEQSGHICKVGFDMYMEMLEKAVSELKGIETAEEFEPQIKLRLPAFIPDDYVPDISLRLSLYRRLAALKTVTAVEEFVSELGDRFGRVPEAVLNLSQIIRLKILARQLYISRVEGSGERIRFTVAEDITLPEGFRESLLATLFEMQKASKAGTFRFLENGFELVAVGAPIEKALTAMMSLTETLAVR